MEIDILSYGIARDIVGSSQLKKNVESDITVGRLLEKLKADYPDFEKLASLAVAVNNEYASGEYCIQPGDEVVLIPPVSGG